MLERSTPKIDIGYQAKGMIPEPLEAKAERSTRASSCSLEKDDRQRCRRANPGEAGRLSELRKWSRGFKEARVPTVPRAGCEGSERAAQRGQLLDWQRTPSNTLLSVEEQMRVRKLPRRVHGNTAWSLHKARNRACSPQPTAEASQIMVD